MEAASEQVRSIANDQKALFADQIGGIAQALDKVATELDGKDATVAGYVHAAADRAQTMTDAMRDHSVESILAAAEDFGRKQPLMFIGGAALAGFAASRFLRASALRTRSQSGGATPERPHNGGTMPDSQLAGGATREPVMGDVQ
jgi:hypothetical protein